MATCPKCKTVFRTLPDEEQDHPCPKCGWAPWIEELCCSCGNTQEDADVYTCTICNETYCEECSQRACEDDCEACGEFICIECAEQHESKAP
jgi:hypothetical protein